MKDPQSCRQTCIKIGSQLLVVSACFLTLGSSFFAPFPFHLLLIFFWSGFWTLLGGPLQKRIQTTLSKKVLSGFYPIHTILHNLSEKLVNLSDRLKVVQTISQEFALSMELKSVHALVPDVESPGQFVLIGIKWTAGKPPTLKTVFKGIFDTSHLFVSGVQQLHAPTLLEKMEAWAQEGLPSDIVPQSLVLPMRSPEKLEGVLILGPKLAETQFSEPDLEAFGFIMDQVLLVFDRISHQEYLNQVLHDNETTHRAALTSMALGISHEIRNPVSAIINGAEGLHHNLIGLEGLDPFPWRVVVDAHTFLDTCGQDVAISEQIYTWLHTHDYLSETGELNTRLLEHNPFFVTPLKELDPELLPYQKEILKTYSDLFKKTLILSFLHHIKDDAQRIVQICNTMLQYGAQSDVTSKTKIDISGPLDDAVSMITKLFGKKRPISIQYQKNHTGLILGEPIRLFQAFNILFTNAVEAMLHEPKTKALILSISTADTEAGVCVSIQDTGCGIETENLDKLRNPFFSTKSPSNGKNAGLGLSILYEIIDKHGGKIEIQSTPSVGTTFMLHFPTV